MKNKIILTASGIIGTISILTARNLRPNKNEFLTGISLSIFAVCVLPWLVYARRKLLAWEPAASVGWKITVRILLATAILIGPLVTSITLLWIKLAKPTDAWGGFGAFITSVALVYFSHCVGLGLFAIAFLIQLWRNQWQKTLNPLAIAYQLLVILLFFKIIT